MNPRISQLLYFSRSPFSHSERMNRLLGHRLAGNKKSLSVVDGCHASFSWLDDLERKQKLLLEEYEHDI